MRHRDELAGNTLARQIHKRYQRALRADRRQMRRNRRRYEGGWVYRTFLWPDPLLSLGGYALVALTVLFFSLLLFGQVTHGGDPLWWARCSAYAHCRGRP